MKKCNLKKSVQIYEKFCMNVYFKLSINWDNIESDYNQDKETHINI